MSESVLLALGAAAGYGVADFLGGFYGRKLSILTVLLVSHAAGLLVLGSLVAAFGRTGAVATDVAWGALSGMASMMGGYFLLRGFAVGRFSVVSTVAAVTAAGLPLLADVALGARPSPRAWVGIVLGLASIVLISTGDADRFGRRRALASGSWFAVLSGVGYALMYLALDRAGPDSGAWPAVAREGAFVVVVGGLALAGGWRPAIPRHALFGVAGIGVAAAFATASFVFATQVGLVGIAAVIASMSPAVTILLARAFLAEGVTPPQVLGLLGAGAALALIGIGT